ncbi:DNA-binding GntR family transcriptional regulator [Bradyrhizobium sp. USDA 4449]
MKVTTREARSGSVNPISRQSLPDAIAAALRERILSGEFRDGDPIVQEAIAEEYEVSRMPVREALRQLEGQGLVALKTHKGAIVTSMKKEKVSELFDLRALLECDILARALPHFGASDAAVAQGFIDQLESAYHRRDTAEWGKLNWLFHKSLYLPANRPETLTIIEGINIQAERFIRVQLVMTGAIATAEREHRELLGLCTERNPVAVDYLRKHILEAGKLPASQSA